MKYFRIGGESLNLCNSLRFQQIIMNIINSSCTRSLQLLISSSSFIKLFCAVYVLMTRRTRLAYVAIFNYLKREHGFTPAIMISDFESGLMAAARLVFDQVKLSGCYFHYCQVSFSTSNYISPLMGW